MPIAKVAIEAYLNRQLDTKTWFKDLTEEQVEEDLASIRPAPKFRVPLRLDQKICFLLGVAYPGTLFLTDLGLGKTALSLELLTYFNSIGYMRRGFVFTPTNEVAEGWQDEIERWKFDIPFIRLSERSSAKKWESLSEFDDGLIIGTYIGIGSMASKLTNIKPKRGTPEPTPDEKAKRKRVLQKGLLSRLFEDTDAVVFDQSTKASQKDTLAFGISNAASQQAQIRYGLAGRAFGRDPAPLWAQLYLVDRGKALGSGISVFREAFFRRERHAWGHKWVERKRRTKLMGEFVAASSIRYSVEECIDLPPKVMIKKTCRFPDDNWLYYEQVQEELLAARGNYRAIKNAFLRMRQISSGFAGFIDDDTGERANIEFEENPKLDMLMQYLSEVPAEHKAIIVHEFNWSGARICRELAREKYKFGWLHGGTKDWTDIKRNFNDDPEYRVLVLNHKKGAMGLNLHGGEL